MLDGVGERLEQLGADQPHEAGEADQATFRDFSSVASLRSKSCRDLNWR